MHALDQNQKGPRALNLALYFPPAHLNQCYNLDFTLHSSSCTALPHIVRKLGAWAELLFGKFNIW